MRKPLASKDQGQSIILLALFFFFVFLAFAALAVDGTNIYLRRRQLQNIADAAALTAAQQLAQTQDVAAAYQVAMDSIAENRGHVEWYSTSASPNPPITNVGSGEGLMVGIEITGACDVRVALLWNDIGTYFAQFVGQDTLQVGANARAGCNKAGGLQPIAVKRFGDERDWNPSLTNANDASVYCDECSTHQSLTEQGLHNATDFLRPDSADTISEWPGWPDGAEMYAPPSPFADLASGALGREYFVLGANTDPNVGTTSYAGLVNLDIRHVASPPVEYYNGVTAGTQSNTLKDLGEYYIRRGYCCDIPVPGDQVAMYNGGSTAFAPQAFQETYAVGDIVAVIVYNGHVFNSPSLAVTGDDPNYKVTHPTTATIASNVLTYSINLEATNGFQSAVGGITMNVEGLAGFANWAFTPTSSPVLGRNGINERTITLVVTPTTTTVGTTTQVLTGTRMFYVSAIDDKLGGTGLRRYWAGIATVGDTVDGVQRDLAAVTGTPTNPNQTYPFISVVKGQQAKYQIQLDLWGVASNRSVTISAGALPTGFEWVSTPPWTVLTQYNKHAGATLTINLKVNDTAAASASPYAIPLTVSAAGMAPQTFNLYVIVEETQTTVTKYVEILGYAAFEVTGYYNSGNPVGPGQPANAVRGRIVSQMMSDPSDLILGLRARLIPWNQ
jgi:hypothetical protein